MRRWIDEDPLVLLTDLTATVVPTAAGLSVPVAAAVALVVSVGITMLVWKLGVIQLMVSVQNRRQGRLDGAWKTMDEHPETLSEAQKRSLRAVGRRRLTTFQFGTGRSAAISFLGMFWCLSFGLTLFALLMMFN